MNESNDKSIEEIFEESWIGPLAHYHQQILYSKVTWLIPMDHLIHQLRLRGLDRQLRAGSSMERLILSRSKQYGLRDDQLSIMFCPTPHNTVLVVQHNIDSSEPFHILSGEIKSKVEALLEKLLKQPIN
jgi:hypothetical protein